MRNSLVFGGQLWSSWFQIFVLVPRLVGAVGGGHSCFEGYSLINEKQLIRNASFLCVCSFEPLLLRPTRQITTLEQNVISPFLF